MSEEKAQINENQQPVQKPKPHKIKGYVDTTDSFSNKGLTRAEWFLNHKLSLHKWLVIILVTLNSILIIYSLYGWGRYFLYDYTNIDRSLVELTQPVIHYENLEPRAIQLRNVQVFSAGRDTYDFMVDVVNPNRSWKAKVTYQFSFAGGVSNEITDVVYPGDGQILTAFGVSAAGFPINLRAEIKDIVWERINPHAVPDPISFTKTRVDVSVENVEFIPANQREGIVSHSIGFDVVNNSVYGYWVPTFDAVLINNQSPVGVARFEIDGFRPGDSKRIELNSLAPTLRVTDVKVLSKINVFDQAEYIPPGE